jgi:NAD+ kinase
LDKLEKLKHGDFSTSRRMLLDAQIGGETFHALNDVVLHRSPAQRKLPNFAVVHGSTEVLKIRADGIIVSTPTGSTAYSLSAGGPIIEPELECFLVTALSPHSLFNRPMIFSPDTHLDVLGSDSLVAIDGGDGRLLQKNEKVTISKSRHQLDLIDIDGNSFYDSIHNKLMKPLKS